MQTKAALTFAQQENARAQDRNIRDDYAWFFAAADHYTTERGLIAFVVIRAASIHSVDAWVTANAAGMRQGWWVELAFLLTIASAAIARLQDQRL